MVGAYLDHTTMRQTLHQRLITLVLLMAYAITGTSVFPAVMVMAATYDGSHSVQISCSDKGTTVTLKHSRDSFTPDVADHSNSLARALVSLCNDANSGDHQLSCAQFQFNAGAERESIDRVTQIEPFIEFAAVCPFHPEAFPPIPEQAGSEASNVPEFSLTGILATVRLLI